MNVSVGKGRFIILALLVIIAAYLSSLLIEYLDTRDNDLLLTSVSASESLIVKTEDIFNSNQDFGKLTIRYFYLEAEEKSGDAILIKSPNGKTMLIDAGMVQTGAKLNEYLEKLNVQKIDYAIATHPHHDHIGGYHTLFKEVEIGKLLLPNIIHTTDTYQQFINVMNEEKIKPQYIYAGERFNLDDQIVVEVLSPKKNDVSKSTSENLSTTEINNLSLVLKVSFKDTTFLFPGDIYKKQEKELVKLYGDVLDVDFLHAPHHGDKTSSTQTFIDTVSPKYTIVNSNILQSKKIIRRYKKNGSNVLIPSESGNILIESDGKLISVTPELSRGTNK